MEIRQRSLDRITLHVKRLADSSTTRVAIVPTGAVSLEGEHPAVGLLASTQAYLRTTINAPLSVICSS